MSKIIIDPLSQSGQVIENQTQIKEIFRDIEGASQIIAESPQFDQDTAKSLMEVMMIMMMMIIRRRMRFLWIAPSFQNGFHVNSITYVAKYQLMLTREC